MATFELISVRKPSYITPKSKRKVVLNEVFEAFGEEAETIRNTGMFHEHPDTPTIDSLFTVVEKTKIARQLPEDWAGLNLLIKTGGGIGDCLIASAVAAYLKKRPCVVCMAVSSNALPFIEHVKEVDGVIDLINTNDPSQEAKFDVVLDLSDFLKKNERQVVDCNFYDRAYKLCGIPPTEVRLPTIEVSKEMRDTFNVKNQAHNFVAIHTDASANHREWSDSNWQVVINTLLEHNQQVLVLGKKGYRFSGKGVIDCSEWSPEKQLHFLQRSRLFVGIDSCFLHFAGVMHVPTVALLGFSDAHNTTGYYRSPVVIKGESPCQCQGILRSSDCIAGYECMQSVSIYNVVRAIDQFYLPSNQYGKYDVIRKKQFGMIEQDANEATAPRADDLRSTEEILRESEKRLHNTVGEIKKQLRVCAVFPWLRFGGGEISMVEVIKGIQPFFDVSVFAFEWMEPKFQSIQPTLEKEFKDELTVLRLCDQRDGIFDEFDVVLWYGVNDVIPKILSKSDSRPVSIRVCHTHFDMDGVDYVMKWQKVIDTSIAVSPQIGREINGIVATSEAVCNPIPSDLDKSDYKHVKTKKTTLGFLGRFSENKNIKWLIENLNETDCNLVVKGIESDEIRLGTLTNLATANGVKDRVKFLTPDRDLGSFFGQIDALVIASGEEAFPMSVIESGFFKTPVISTPVGALPEVFADQIIFMERGVQAPNIQSFKDAIKKISKEKGSQLQRRVNELCDPKNVAIAYRQIIREAFGRSFPVDMQIADYQFEREEGLGDVIMSTALVSKAIETLPLATFHYKTKEQNIDLLARTFPEINVSSTRLEEATLIPVDYDKCWTTGTHIVEGMGGRTDEIVIEPVDMKKTPRNKPKIGLICSQNSSANIKYQIGKDGDKRYSFLNDNLSSNVDGFVNSIQNMNYIITIDNAAVHIGQALNIPMVCIFGKSSYPKLSSYDIHLNVVSKSDKSCIASIDNRNHGAKGCCKEVTEACQCMLDVPVKDVVQKFNELKAKIS
jgi:ADP-heptose:LPS heptosyltransferase